MPEPVVVLDHVTRHFGAIAAVADLSLSIERGEMFGLIGPDGAGKTTTIRLICGLLRADTGTLRVLGHDPVRQHGHITQHAGYLSQRFSLYGDLSIDENIAFFAELHGMRDYTARRNRLLEMTQLTPFRRSARRPALGRHEAEAGAGVHARARAAGHPARRADDGRRSRVAARVLEAAVGVSRAGHHDRHVDAVPRRGRALLARGPAVGRTAARRRHACGAPAGACPAWSWNWSPRRRQPRCARCAQLDGVADVESFGERLHVRLVGADSAVLLERLGADLRRAGITATNIRAIPASLEDVFINRVHQA